MVMPPIAVLIDDDGIDYFNALEQLCSSASTKTLFEISNYCTRERQLLIINVNSVTVQCKY